MPITIKTDEIKVRKESGGYKSINAVSESTTDEQIRAINEAGTSNVTKINTKAAEVTSQLANAGELEDMIADAFDPNTNYSAGDYVIQTDNDVNKLYKFTADHEASDWTGTDVVETKIGAEVEDLKKAFDNAVITSESFAEADWEDGALHAQTGKTNSSLGYIRTKDFFAVDSFDAIKSQDECVFLIFAYSQANVDSFLGWWNGSKLVSTTGSTPYYTDGQYIAPIKSAGATYIRICARRINGTIAVSDGANIFKGKNRTNGAVHYDDEQDLTTAQKTQARDNIDAAWAEDVESLMDTVNDEVFQAVNYTASEWEEGAIDARYGNTNSSSGYIRTKEYISVDSVFKITSQDGVKFLPFCYTYVNGSYSYLGWWNGSAFVAATGSGPYYSKSQYIAPIKTTGATFIRLCAVPEANGGTISVNDSTKISATIDRIGSIEADIDNIESQIDDNRRNKETLTDLVTAQKAIADDWHFAFINVYDGMGLGAKHLIPGTKNLWSQSATEDLNQQHVWMQDGTHPFKGTGVTDMYARTIAPQLAMVVPSYRDGVGLTTPSVWSERNVLWMGTSIPKGSDPDAGEGQGATYPELVCDILGASAINIARGSSCLRINASTGTYDQMLFAHLLRAVTRTVAECDLLAANWSNIDKTKIVNATETLSASDIATMKSHSFENLLLPYLDGTNDMPDLFVIDYGHNDVRPRGVDGENDLWIEPSPELINSGILAEDTYMTSNSYANLKTALNNDLSGITDKASFAASLNRNCFKGAVNFLVTLILRYNPYARIVIVSDYN